MQGYRAWDRVTKTAIETHFPGAYGTRESPSDCTNYTTISKSRVHFIGLGWGLGPSLWPPGGWPGPASPPEGVLRGKG